MSKLILPRFSLFSSKRWKKLIVEWTGHLNKKICILHTQLSIHTGNPYFTGSHLSWHISIIQRNFTLREPSNLNVIIFVMKPS